MEGAAHTSVGSAAPAEVTLETWSTYQAHSVCTGTLAPGSEDEASREYSSS